MNSAAAGSDVFKAIADPNRRRIVELLSERERPVEELVDHFDISFAAVSQHLKLLRSAGVVTRRAEGRRRVYRLNAAPLRRVSDWASHYERAWKSRLRRLRSVLDARS